MKTRQATSTHKKVVVELLDRKLVRGYVNPGRLPGAASLDLLTPEGEHVEIQMAQLRRQNRPGRLLEGVIPNDLLAFVDNGLQITPPDLNSNTDRIYVPRSALSELTVLGVVGVARRKPAPGAEQPRLFNE